MIGEKLIRIKSLFPLGIDQKFDIKSPQAKNFSSFETMRLFFCFFGPSVVLATTKGNVLEKKTICAIICTTVARESICSQEIFRPYLNDSLINYYEQKFKYENIKISLIE